MNHIIEIQQDYHEYLVRMLDDWNTYKEQHLTEFLDGSDDNIPKKYYDEYILPFKKSYLSLFDVTAPLKIINCFVLCVEHVDVFIKEIKNSPSPKMPLSEAFEVLTKLPNYTALVLLGQIDCSERVHEILVDALNSKDQDQFIETLKDVSGLEKFFTPFKELGKLYMALKARDHEINSDEDFEIWLDASNSFLADIETSYGVDMDKYHKYLEKLNQHRKQNTNFQTENQVLNSCKEFTECLNAINEYDLRKSAAIYNEYKKYFTFKERGLVEKIVSNPDYPDAAKWYYDTLEILEKEDQVESEDSCAPLCDSKDEFHIPEDFEKLEIDLEKENHFVCNNIRMIKGDNLENFLNYLNDLGYLARDPETLQTFVYRMTGKMGPAKLGKLDWGGNKNNLLHLVQYVTERRQKPGKYVKVKLYFNGFEEIKEPNKNAYQPTKEFEEKIKELFPS